MRWIGITWSSAVNTCHTEPPAPGTYMMGPDSAGWNMGSHRNIGNGFQSLWNDHFCSNEPSGLRWYLFSNQICWAMLRGSNPHGPVCRSLHEVYVPPFCIM